MPNPSPEKQISSLQERVESLEQKLRARTFELGVLHELSERIGYSLSYEELFRLILTHLEKAIPCEVAAGLLVMDGGRNLYLRPLSPLSSFARDEIEHRLLDAFQRLGGIAVERHELTTTILPREAFRADRPSIETLQSFFQVPIIADGVHVGLIFLGSSATDHFTEDQVRLLYTVAHQAASAVERLQAVFASERRRLQTVVDHLPTGVILLDTNQRVTLANPAGREYLKSLAGASVGDVLHRLGSQSFEEILQRSEFGDPQDLVIEGPPRRILQPAIIPIHEKSQAEEWMFVLQDVTDARHAVRRRDNFLAMLAHELRNPLAPVLNAARLLEKPGLEQTTRGEAVAVIARQTGQMARLVDDLLDVSRFLHGKIRLQMKPLNLTDVLRRTAETHRPLIEDQQQTLRVDLPSEPVWIEGDAVRMTQVVSNLLGNATKYTPPGGMISLHCRRGEADEVVVRVCDTGIGIAAEDLGRVFDAFVQSESSPIRSQDGLGLGLALVQTLVARHGGTVTVTSDGLGQGSEFTVRLPITTPPPTEIIEPKPSTHPVSRRILVVEDNRDAREMLQRLLAHEGHQVVGAGTGREGVEVFRTHQPEVCLIDLGLPEMDGYDVARAIRAEPGGRETRLCALTGYAQPEDRHHTSEAGFDDHLVKPLDLDQLRRILNGATPPERKEAE